MSIVAHGLQSQGIRLAEELRRKLTDTLGAHIQVVLFGSQARGDATEGSDYDILVVLPSLGKSTLDTVLEIAWEVGFKAGQVISVVPATFGEMELLSASPFFQTVQREGILV